MPEESADRLDDESVDEVETDREQAEDASQSPLGEQEMENQETISPSTAKRDPGSRIEPTLSLFDAVEDDSEGLDEGDTPLELLQDEEPLTDQVEDTEDDTEESRGGGDEIPEPHSLSGDGRGSNQGADSVIPNYSYPGVDGFDKVSQIDYWVKITGDRDVGRESVLAQYREAASAIDKQTRIYGARMPDQS